MPTAQITNIMQMLEERYPGKITSMQVDCCRRIGVSGCNPDDDNGRAWSQHAYGNAVDVFVPDKVTGTRIYLWLTSQQISQQITGLCWLAFGGCDESAHQDHIHIEGNPKLRGTPPCAGGAKGDVQGSSVIIPGVWESETVAEWDEAVQRAIALGDPADLIVRALWVAGGAALFMFGLVQFGKVLGLRVPLPPAANLVRSAT